MCDPCFLPGCIALPSVVPLWVIANGYYFQSIPNLDDKVYFRPSWTRDSGETERWVTEPPTDPSITICGPRNQYVITTSKAAKAVYNEWRALGEPSPRNATFVFPLLDRLFDETGSTIDQAVEMATDTDTIFVLEQYQSRTYPKAAKRHEL